MSDVSATVEAWARRKLSAEPYRPLRERTISREWRKVTGRVLFGSVTLRVAPAAEFRFIDNVNWPEEGEMFSQCVLDGILDALLLDVGAAPGAAVFTLLSAEWRDLDSVPHAYGRAAREAVGELYGLNERERLGMAEDDHAI